MRKLIWILLAMMVLTGCVSRSRLEYFPAEPGTAPGLDGNVRGSVRFEEHDDGFTLGTQGLGSYTFIQVSIF